MADSEGENYNEVNRSNVARTDYIGDTELIRTEGTPGWMEKFLRKVIEFLPKVEALR